MNFINQAIAYLKLHWITVLLLLTAVWKYASPTVADYVHNHPNLSFWYGLAAVIIAFYIQSPAQAKLIKLLRGGKP